MSPLFNPSADVKVLSSAATVVGNVGTGEDDLMTFTLPANTLSSDGQGVRIRAWFTGANNANLKSISLKFGATQIASTGASVVANNLIYVDAVVMRTGSSAQESISFRTEGLNNTDPDFFPIGRTTPAENMAADIIIKGTGTGVADNDIIQRAMIIELLK